MARTDPSPGRPPLWLAYPEEVADASLGEKLKGLRREKGGAQDEFACAAQIDGRQVGRYENDRVMSSLEVVVKMAEAFNVSLDFLPVEDVPRRPLDRHLSKLAERVLNLGTLSEEGERSLLHFLDSIEAKNKLKSLAAEVG